MFSKEAIRQKIKTAIVDVSDWDSVGFDESLISKDSRIIPANFLYIFDQIEKALNIPVCKIFETHSHNVMTINNLTDAFYTLQSQEDNMLNNAAAKA